MFDSSSSEQGNAPPGPNEEKTNPAILRLKKKETGIAREVMANVKHRFKNDPKRQIDEFFQAFPIPSGTGRKRTVSLRTTKCYRERMATVVQLAKELNMPIRNLDELSPKIVKHVFRKLEKDGASPGWLANINTTVRRFGIWIGKPDLCPQISKLVEWEGSTERQFSVTVAKDWESINQDVDHIISLIGLECEVTSLQLTLARHFGLRVQEVLMLKPERCETPRGYIHLTDGSKGGRPRIIPIETPEQRKALEEAKEIARKHPKGLLMAKPGHTLHQAIRYFYRQMEKIGVTKENKGITAHGLRHGYACRTYQKMTGELPPVLGGGVVDPHLDKKARLEISERLGHGRPDVVSAYIGSHQSMDRAKKKSLQFLIDVVEGDPEIKLLTLEAQLTEIHVLGAAADGQPIGKGTSIPLGYVAQAKEGETQYQADKRAMGAMYELSIRMSQMLGATVSSTPLSSVMEHTSRFELTGLSFPILQKEGGV